jgi:hypothetical protein
LEVDVKHEDLKKYWEAEEKEWQRLGILRPMMSMERVIKDMRVEMDGLKERIRKEMLSEVKTEVERLIKNRMVKVELVDDDQN